jgi:hypothetical protein
MKQLRLTAIALLMMSALGVVAASAAQAEEAPYWTVKGTRLEKGQTRFITGKELAPFVISGGGVSMTCTETSALPHGVLLGSEPGEHGTADMIASMKGCKVTGNGSGSECDKVTEPINTTNLKMELVLDAETKTKLLALIEPASGSTFAEVKFPNGCKVESTKVTGTIVGRILNSKEEEVTTSSSKAQEESGLLRFPATQPVEVWLVKEGTGKEVENKELTASGAIVDIAGTALGLLAELNSKNELVSTKELWSSLA